MYLIYKAGIRPPKRWRWVGVSGDLRGVRRKHLFSLPLKQAYSGLRGW